MKRPIPLSEMHDGFGWTERDTHVNPGASRQARQSTAGPEVEAGEVYQVHYDRPFAWTRHTRTNYMYGPDGSGIGCMAQKQLLYSWKGVKAEETRLATQPNYMFVLGTVNYTHSRQFLVLFYKPCQNVHLPCTASSGMPPQGTWLPAIYSPDSGTLFSEVGTAQVHGRRNVLGWTCRSSTHTILDTTQDCGVDLEMSHAEVTAKRVTSNALLVQIRAHILLPMFQYLVESDSSIIEFANLFPTLHTLPAGVLSTALVARIHDYRQVRFSSADGTDPKPEQYRFSPSAGYNSEHNRAPMAKCAVGAAPCPSGPATTVSCSCDL